MTRSPIIRPARTSDAAALRAILYDTFEGTWRPAISEAAAIAFRAEDRPSAYVAARGHLFWVAECDGAIAGFCDFEGDFINALHVRTSHARTGVGSRLMDHAETSIAASGRDAVRLETDTFNERARAFYHRRGFVEIGRYPDLEWGSDLTTVLLSKALA